MSFSLLAGGTTMADPPPTPSTPRQPARGGPRSSADGAGGTGGNKDRWSSSYSSFDVIPLSVKKEMLEAMDEKNCNAYRTADWNRDIVDAHLFIGVEILPSTKLRHPLQPRSIKPMRGKHFTTLVSGGG